MRVEDVEIERVQMREEEEGEEMFECELTGVKGENVHEDKEEGVKRENVEQADASNVFERKDQDIL